MTRPELDRAVDWAAAEGWNPGLHDADAFFAADPTGFWVGVLDGAAIASLSAVRYGQSFGFIGFYIVKPEYRGKGYGLALWQAGLKYLNGRTIGLDGVIAQQANYLKAGFQLAHRNIRYEGRSVLYDPSPLATEALTPLDAVAIADIVAYDRAFFPDDRTRFLQHWLRESPGSYAVGWQNQRQQLNGYGVIRPCRSGYKIGPLFADTPDIAEALFMALQAQTPANSLIYLDCPEPNGEAIALTQRHAMTSMFETARMYRGVIPNLPLERTFGITTFELG